MTTVLCLWEGKGHYREKQVCWSFDVRCLTSPVPGWELGEEFQAAENKSRPLNHVFGAQYARKPGWSLCVHSGAGRFIGLTGLAGSLNCTICSHSHCKGIVCCWVWG